MTGRIGATIAMVASATQAVGAQVPLRAAYDSAYYAWDAGLYPEALRTFQRLLASGGDAFLDDIALLTGERYRTAELAPDGTQPSWSGDGRLLAYGTPSGSPTTTRIVALADGGPRLVAELLGTGAAFSPDGGSVAYLKLQEGPELQRALADVRAAIEVRSRADFARVRRAVSRVNGEHTTIVVRDLASGRERAVATPEIGVASVAYGADGETIYVLGNEKGDATRSDIYAVRANTPLRRVTSAPGLKSDFQIIPGGAHAMYAAEASFAVVDLAGGDERLFVGSSATPSRDGSAITFLGSDGSENTVQVMRIGSEPVEVERTPLRLANPSLSPKGDRVVYQKMLREDWELMVVAADGSGSRRLTHEIQHDLFPRFLADDVILAVIGEGRHRRSYLYDADTGQRTRLFHNNTIRTVAPEYEWVASADGSRVAIVSERDGDTISPERGLYVVDLDRPLGKDDIVERLGDNLAAEEDLRARGTTMFAPVADEVRIAVADVSTGRIYDYANDLFAFGSKFITQPGNALAIEYIEATLRSFGYEPELQWFEPRPGVPSANIIATLPGTVDPELVYVLSSHFDSVERGPGADDNTSGTTALLEAARVLAGRPQPATIKFAFFTGEEAGLLGSREYVRQAVAAGDKIVGALNNDMVGFANNNRLDNTIRYSNAGIRDVQHAAAFLFTGLITYDAKYYKSTDAHAYYEAYGDIVGGIGSYPILGNPHYHQVHDVLETINQQLVAEVSKTTVATLMLLASSPSRVTGLEVERGNDGVTVRWTPAVESTIDHYIVAYGPEDDPRRELLTVSTPAATLAAPPGTVVSVKAVNRGGMESWDWAQAIAQ